MSDCISNDLAAKAATYNDRVGKIADYLYTKFYAIAGDTFDAYYDPEMERIKRGECLDKADRMYHFFGDVAEVKKMMEFLNTVNPGLAKDLVDGL